MIIVRPVLQGVAPEHGDDMFRGNPYLRGVWVPCDVPYGAAREEPIGDLGGGTSFLERFDAPSVPKAMGEHTSVQVHPACRGDSSGAQTSDESGETQTAEREMWQEVSRRQHGCRRRALPRLRG